MRFLDLSQPMNEGIPVYPGDPLFESRPFAEHETDGFHGTRYVVGSHLGTHLDAPFHYFLDGETLDSFPADFFFGQAACLNLAPLVGLDSPRRRDRADRTRPVALTVEDLAPFEPIFDATPIVLLRVGWSSRAGRPEYYDDFPSLSPDVCDWLADYPALRILGLETPSLVATSGDPAIVSEAEQAPATAKFDPELDEFLRQDRVALPNVPSTAQESEGEELARPLDELELLGDAECHRILLGRRPPILILEGLVNLESLPQYDRPEDGSSVAPDPSRAFELACQPLPILGADGCPVRAVARVETPNENRS